MAPDLLLHPVFNVAKALAGVPDRVQVRACGVPLAPRFAIRMPWNTDREGIIKSVMGLRQFLLRGLDCVRGEWSLVTMAWNIKRMHALSLG
jgi:hypothetical protein